MTTSTLYFNLVKFITVAFVLGFCAYVVHADEVVMDVGAFQTCTDCMAENHDDVFSGPKPGRQTEGKPADSRIISVAVLSPDLSNFDSVQLAVVEIADLEIVADYLSYSFKDINQDGKTDMVFYFSYGDLIPPNVKSDGTPHDACLFVDIMRKDKSINNLNLCEHNIVLAQAGEKLI